jgi:hypothetical protein
LFYYGIRGVNAQWLESWNNISKSAAKVFSQLGNNKMWCFLGINFGTLVVYKMH